MYPFISLNLIKMEKVVYLGDYALPVIEIHPNSKSIEGRGIEVFTSEWYLKHKSNGKIRKFITSLQVF